MPPIEIHLQPSQWELEDLILQHEATVIGVGGGRGAAKSGGADRIALNIAIEQPGSLQCVVMRNADQVRKYHEEPIVRDFPVLEGYLHKTNHVLKIPTQGTYSELVFSYSENLEDVKRRFRSGNYRYIWVDQAEQFTWEELSEIMLANRSKGGIIGGIGIEALRDRFSPAKKFNEN